jgi:hypothetical protein
MRGVGVLIVQAAPRSKIRRVEKEREIALFQTSKGKLSRQVVSVEFKGKLAVLRQAYTRSGDIAADGSIFITPQECNTSQHKIVVGGSEVNITFAWSLLVEDKTLISMTGYVDPLAYCPPMPSFLTEKLGLPEK